MQSGNKQSFLNPSQKSILILFIVLIICSVLALKNFIFQPTFLLKKFGQSSIDPEIAFTNNKPTFLEFYADWCEVCKEMAPKVDDIKKKYEKDINFVFLNVDNPKWEKYIRNFNVNGIPQINIFDIINFWSHFLTNFAPICIKLKKSRLIICKSYFRFNR